MENFAACACLNLAPPRGVLGVGRHSRRVDLLLPQAQGLSPPPHLAHLAQVGQDVLALVFPVPHSRIVNKVIGYAQSGASRFIAAPLLLVHRVHLR